MRSLKQVLPALIFAAKFLMSSSSCSCDDMWPENASPKLNMDNLSVPYLGEMPDELSVDTCWLDGGNRGRPQIGVDHIPMLHDGVWIYNLTLRMSREEMQQICIVVNFTGNPTKYVNMSKVIADGTPATTDGTPDTTDGSATTDGTTNNETTNLTRESVRREEIIGGMVMVVMVMVVVVMALVVIAVIVCIRKKNGGKYHIGNRPACRPLPGDSPESGKNHTNDEKLPPSVRQESVIDIRHRRTTRGSFDSSVDLDENKSDGANSFQIEHPRPPPKTDIKMVSDKENSSQQQPPTVIDKDSSLNIDPASGGQQPEDDTTPLYPIAVSNEGEILEGENSSRGKSRTSTVMVQENEE